MGDHLARANNYEKRAEKKLSRRGLFGCTLSSPNHQAAAILYDKAADAFQLAESWDRAGAVYVKQASCHLEINSKLEAAQDFIYASYCYEKSKSVPETISCLERAAKIYECKYELDTCAKYYKKIARLFEQEKNVEKATLFYEKAANLFIILKCDYASGNQYRLEIARLAAQLEQYSKAIEIYEGIARASLYDKSIKYSTKALLLSAGMCQVCKGDIENALERYLKLDPAFDETGEYRFLVDLGNAVREKDASKFTQTVEKYDGLAAWETALLLRVTEAIKAREVEEEDGMA